MAINLDRGAQPEIVSFFIDEAGTPTLFGRHGKIVAGSETSRYLDLGKLEVEHPARLTRRLAALRAETNQKHPHPHPLSRKAGRGERRRDPRSAEVRRSETRAQR